MINRIKGILVLFLLFNISTANAQIKSIEHSVGINYLQNLIHFNATPKIELNYSLKTGIVNNVILIGYDRIANSRNSTLGIGYSLLFDIGEHVQIGYIQYCRFGDFEASYTDVGSHLLYCNRNYFHESGVVLAYKAKISSKYSIIPNLRASNNYAIGPTQCTSRITAKTLNLGVRILYLIK